MKSVVMAGGLGSRPRRVAARLSWLLSPVCSFAVIDLTVVRPRAPVGLPESQGQGRGAIPVGSRRPSLTAAARAVVMPGSIDDARGRLVVAALCERTVARRKEAA